MNNRVNAEDFPGEAIHRLEHDLRERTRELNCLYGIAHIADRSGGTLEKILQGIVDLLPQAWQYPDKACSRIIMGMQEFRTDNFKETPFKQASGIAVHGKRIGTVEVLYLEESPECGEGPFLKQERRLIEMIAGRLGKLIEQKTTEEAIRKSEEKYRSIFENAVEGIFQTTPEGTFLTVNPSCVKMFGYSSPEEFTSGTIDVGKHIYANPGDRVRFKELMDERGLVQMFEFPALKKDGTRIWVCLNARAVKDAMGTILYYEGTIEDITSLKEAEQEARENEERYHRLFDLVSDAIFLIDNETGRIIEANDAALSLYGYSKEELLEKKNTDLLAESEQVIEPVQKEPTVVHYYRKKDGTVFPVESTVTHLVWNGRRSHLTAIRDITQRKEVEEELERERMHLRLVIDTVPNYIFAKDIEGSFLLANKAVADVFGVDTKDMVGKTDLDCGIKEEQRHAYDMAARAVIESGKPLFIPEEQIMRKDGTLGWFQTTRIPYRRHLGGDKPAILGVSVDITEKKEMEERLKTETQRFLTLVENAPFGTVLVDKKGKYIYMNTKFKELFGYDFQEVPDENVWFAKAYPDPEYRSHVIATWQNGVEKFMQDPSMKEGEQWTFTVTCRDNQQKVVHVIPVQLPTGEYLKTYEDITEQKRAEDALKSREAELAIKSINLEEMNAALKVLLNEREKDRIELEEKIATNVNKLVFPYIDKLKECRIDPHHMTYVDIIQTNLNNIVSPFLQKLGLKCTNLTPTEIRIADLVRSGKTTKEIGEALQMTSGTVSFYRNNIRKKLGLNNEKTNLTSYLLSL